MINDLAMTGVLILGAVLTIAVIVFLWQAQHSPESPFEAAQMFQDERGRTSGPKLVYVICAFAGIWVLLFMTVDRTMTAEIIGVVLGILMLGKVGSQWIDTKAPPQPSSEETTLIKRTVGATDAPDIPTLTDVAPDPRRKRTKAGIE